MEKKIKEKNGIDKRWFDDECKNQKKKVWNRIKAYLGKATEKWNRGHTGRYRLRQGKERRGKNRSWRKRERIW